MVQKLQNVKEIENQSNSNIPVTLNTAEINNQKKIYQNVQFTQNMQNNQDTDQAKLDIVQKPLKPTTTIENKNNNNNALNGTSIIGQINVNDVQKIKKTAEGE
jgi:hypothetical protein